MKKPSDNSAASQMLLLLAIAVLVRRKVGLAP
jgi:hypothetical protein